MNKEYLNKDRMDFYSISNILYDKDAHFKMRVFADSFLTVIENNNFSLPFNIKRNSNVLIDDLKNQIILSKFKRENPSIVIKEYNESDFLDELMNARGEVSGLNGFQKLLDYDELPNNERRIKALYEEKKRQTIFSDSDSSQEILDSIINYNKDINIKKVRKSDFKREIVNILKNFYFSTNSVDSSDNFYINSYYNFYKSKIDLAAIVYSENNAIVDEKSILSRKFLIQNDTRVQELIETVNDNTEDWRLM
jgi:hypothetical protein